MKKLSSEQVRDMFLDFFHDKHHHTIKHSASLVPKNDPSLLWINSGVATMKRYFDGEVVPKNRRITSSQKSLRTNDIENVGRTRRHQTMFEMLGNFSVGDYFRDQAIAWACDLLMNPNYFGWDPNRLYVTAYPKDHDTKRDWIKGGIPKDHIVNMKSNFWDVGEGPCGPDTEIFYDRGPKFDNLKPGDPEDYPGGENNRWLEVWDIVLSQFNHEPDGSYKPLPHKNIDTGMGLERVVSVFQNAPTNFETDLFLPIIHATEKLSDNRKYVPSMTNRDTIAFKVIADHIRAVTFAINDGALPSNVGRGYVIRRLIRRATVMGRRLGIDHPFLYKLVPVVGKIMQHPYPEVYKNRKYLEKVIHSEEVSFDATLADGLKLLKSVLADVKKSHKKIIPGDVAFKLYDTYGFPLQLTAEYAHEQKLDVDKKGFKVGMKAQQERARKARGNKQAMGIQNDLLVDVKTPSKYVGYHQLHVNGAKITHIVQNDKLVQKADGGTAAVMFSETPFYAEMGGQVADQGWIKDAQGDDAAKVVDVQSAPNGQHLHTVQIFKPLKVGATYDLSVDPIRHEKTSQNHTATHLLDQTLRNVLGGHTHQAGSLVDPHYLRFDFTHFGEVTQKDLKKVEDIINQKIFAALPVKTVVTDPKTGRELGAVAIFNSKYGKKVRVVNIGDYSIEFCGGTHVKNTSELGLFKIVSESGVGAGVRRIVAVTSSDAFDLLNHEEAVLNKTAHQLKANRVEDVPSKISEMEATIKQLKDSQRSLESKVANAQASHVFDNVQTVNGLKLITGVLNVSGMNELRQLADEWRNKKLSNVLVLGTKSKGKANLIVAVDNAHAKNGLKAGDMIKSVAKKIQGGGGGRPNMAQAGGKNPAGLPDAMKAAKQWLSDNAK
ncbi:alanine--tRNA ligase [uncultured bacterium]|nr:alanine--tRNA ligase [uncultured bacterium]